jgi:hypothetical protein
MRRRFITLIASLAVVITMSSLPASASPVTTATPAVSPLTGGNGVPVISTHTTFDLAPFGYEQAEYLIQGTATAYAPAAGTSLTSDGKWTVTPTTPKPFATRILVDRPTDPRKFNGTVIVEWLNVTAGYDASPDQSLGHVELLRNGYAWVGVSAQQVGVDATRAADPQRYAALSHPGDSYSYDIFSQAGQAIQANPGLVLDGLQPQRLLADGESQSARRMVTYINAVHPIAGVYDGYLVHSRQEVGERLTQAPLPVVAPTSPTFFRTDLDVPVLNVQTESDLGGLLARQPDTDRIRLWEIAGAAHADQYLLRDGPVDTGDRQGTATWFESMRNPTATVGAITCDRPINTGPQTFVLRAAIRALDTWVRTGRPPAVAPRLELKPQWQGQADPFVRDANGIALGGIRTPAVDAPIATLSGVGQPVASTANPTAAFCGLFGTTVPFTPQQLTALYRNHGGFVSAWNQATQRAVQSGFILAEDAQQLRTVAAQSSIPR